MPGRGTIGGVLVMIVLLAAVVVVCACVVVVAVGRGGELAEFAHDAPPLGLPVRRPIAGTDVALLRLPAGPWGYSFHATDEALRRIAHALTERDTRIAILEQQVSELRAANSADDQADADDGSPWFDRAATFEGRPSRPPLASGIRAVSPPTSEPAAIEAKPTGDEPEEKPADEPEMTAEKEPEEPNPEDTVAEKPADEPGAKAWVEDKAWAEDRPWPKDVVAGKPAERDEDWVFEDDVEPVVEPLPETPGRSAAVPWPGDRLVASSRTRFDDDPGETAEQDTVEDDTPGEKPDDDATAGGEPRDGERH